MKRYAALLRGVSPMNLKMPALKACFEAAGFEDVKTVLASGNVVFSARATSEGALEKKIEAAMARELDRTFMTIVRSVDDLRAMIEADPYRDFKLSPKAKRVVTFLRDKPSVKLPIEAEGTRILTVDGRDVFSAYVPGPKGGVFMSVLEKALGKEITTRTWDTVKKLAK
jgi:uncharacterized protein (DUF1697 family)